MRNQAQKPLQVILHGMDERTQKTMLMYFQGSCKGAAVIVEEIDAEADIIDIDTLIGKEVLKKLGKRINSRPLIVLSKDPLKLENVFHIEKPVRLVRILAVFNEARKVIEEGLEKVISETEIETELETKVIAKENKKSIFKTQKIKNIFKYKPAMPLNETHSSVFIGLMTEINFNDEAEVLKAYYSPKDYYQGYVAAAFKVSKSKDRVIQLNSNWKSLLIFPHSNEIWLDANDKQLRAIAAVEMNKATGVKLTLTAANLELVMVKKKSEYFDDMDAFIWKLAIWTSRGRYPQVIDIKSPIYLEHPPNFSRVIITPHALQIAALLVEEPRTMLNVSEVLNIKPQYVFVFVSGAYALGLIRQSIKKSNKVIVHPTPILKKKQGMLNRILSQLRS